MDCNYGNTRRETQGNATLTGVQNIWVQNAQSVEIQKEIGSDSMMSCQQALPRKRRDHLV